MRKEHILKENRDFLRLYRRGKCKASPVLVTYCMKNKTQICRFGITATKKVGHAVDRNRAKRLIREAFRSLSGEIPAGWDFVFVSRGKTPHTNMWNVRDTMQEHINLLCKSAGTACSPENTPLSHKTSTENTPELPE